MPWKTMEVHQQRVEFVVVASRREKSLTALCAEFDISRPTGRLWLQRFQQRGLSGLAEGSRRPHRSPRLTAGEREERVVEWRQRYPDWGARKLRVLLQREGIELGRSTIHRILLRHDLLRPCDRHQQAVERFEREHPNELWQMDFKSPIGWETPVGPLSVIDDHSRYVIALQATGHAYGDRVREQLQTAFGHSGVPEAMLMDHGVPWRSIGGPTELALWLMRQGIGLHWSGIAHPQTQGKVERFHGEMERALARRGWQGKSPQQWLDEFRWEHNHLRPHEALGMQTPASRWQPSARAYDPQPRRWEYPAGAHVRRLDGDGKLNAFGRNWNIAQALRREWVQLLRLEERVLVFYCRTAVRELDLSSQRSTIVDRWLEDCAPNQKL